MKKLFFTLATIVTLAHSVQAANSSEVTILRDDFDSANLPPTDWHISFSAGAANVFVDTANSSLVLETVPNTGVGTAVVSSIRSFSVVDNTLIFRSRVLDAYVDQGIYGDAQPRGLVAGTDRNNAIEFINAFPVPNTVACRTVAGGVVTQTLVDIGQSVRLPSVYEIVAKLGGREVNFYINGTLMVTHRTNIPTVPLNVYFSTSDSGFGNVPVTVDYVSFERVPRVR